MPEGFVKEGLQLAKKTFAGASPDEQLEDSSPANMHEATFRTSEVQDLLWRAYRARVPK